MSEAAIETEVNPIEDLIKHSLDQNFNKANDLFGDLMGQKVFDALEAEKIKVANQIYNDEEPEVETEFDTDQIEMDLGELPEPEEGDVGEEELSSEEEIPVEDNET